MAAITLHTGIVSSPKHAPLSDGALRLWLHGLCWSKEHLTDGFIPREIVISLHKSAARLVPQLLKSYVPGKNSLWISVEGGYQIHDYTDWQETCEIVQERRRKWREKKRAAPRESQGASKRVSTGESLGESPLESQDGSGGGGGSGNRSIDVDTSTSTVPPSVEADYELKPNKQQLRVACYEVAALWNQRMPSAPVSVTGLTASDFKRIGGALQTRSIDQLDAVFVRVAASRYLSGRDGEHRALPLWRALEWVSRVESGEFDDRPAKAAGLRGGGSAAPARASPTVMVTDATRDNYRFACGHTPTCTTWAACRDKINEADP
jgi:hypothetical protein